jgi:primary-amine oxidase
MVELECKLTGIVNAWVLGANEARDPLHETIVAPRIAAQHHQHLFSLRVDPMLDGLRNTVSQVDAVPDDAPVGSEENYYGNGFHMRKTVFRTAKEGVADYDSRTARTWAIESSEKTHYASGTKASYKLGMFDALFYYFLTVYPYISGNSVPQYTDVARKAWIDGVEPSSIR